MSELHFSKLNRIIFLWILPIAVIIFVVLAVMLFRVASENRVLLSGTNELEHEDGTYRGIFADGDKIQINVEFTLRNGIVKNARFRHLRRDENYNIDSALEPYKSVIEQYKESLEYLVGKNLQESLIDLYRPERIVTTEVDGYTSATIRSSKIISAIRDALNRGVYSY